MENNQVVQRPQHKRRLSTHPADYEVGLPQVVQTPSNPNSVDLISSGIVSSFAYHVTYEKFNVAHRSFLLAITKEKELSTHQDAIKDSRWQYTMEQELPALESNNTWNLKKLPLRKKATNCKWVYKVKYRSKGSVERFKARILAAKG